jgi:drug/metabolite transporter (DMT)-like permease
VRPARWVALAVGFLGVLLVVRPGPETFQIGALFALANAILFGTVTVGVRGMTATESTATLSMYQMVMLTTAFSLLLPFGFVTPTPFDATIMVFNGLANAVGQYWWTRALHLAPTSAVAPFQYLALVWAIIFGLVIWGDVPTLHLLIGSAIVVASGIFLLWRESR